MGASIASPDASDAKFAVLTHPACDEHQPRGGYPEGPERLRSTLAHLERQGWPVERLGEHPGAREAVLALHDEAYVRRFERAVERGDALLDSADNPLTPGTVAAAWAAVGVTLAAADRVAGGEGVKVLAAVRPPGHHAERAQAMGFCFFNNIAVAAEYLRTRHGLERVAIFDFDVHHGNGTQHLFEARGDVFYASIHQYPFYPGTGAAQERGVGAGEGATLNLPLPARTGDEGYGEAIRGRVLPALAAFRPEALLISAGFDAWRDDPLGGMQVSGRGFADWGLWLAELAEEICGARVLAVLEGGYDLAALPRLVELHLEGLAGRAPAL
jgi:acetoin utilization deacetylase AcuC-like enzyme